MTVLLRTGIVKLVLWVREGVVVGELFGGEVFIDGFLDCMSDICVC